MANHLNTSATFEHWLTIKGLENRAKFCNLSGKMQYQDFDSFA
jgi:hypothetical protein